MDPTTAIVTRPVSDFLVSVFDFLVSRPDVANAAAAIGSAVVASLALFLSLAALWHQRKHNALSVRPLADIGLGNYDNHIFVRVRNHGTGPMIITSTKIINAPNPSAPLKDAMPALEPNVYWRHFVGDCVGRSIPAGGQIVLIDLFSNSKEPAFVMSRDRVRQALSKLELCVEYTDIYGSKLPVAHRSLEVFPRDKQHDDPEENEAA